MIRTTREVLLRRTLGLRLDSLPLLLRIESHLGLVMLLLLLLVLEQEVVWQRKHVLILLLLLLQESIVVL